MTCHRQDKGQLLLDYGQSYLCREDTLPHLAPPSMAPPETYPVKRGRLLPIFTGKESKFTEYDQQGRH